MKLKELTAREVYCSKIHNDYMCAHRKKFRTPWFVDVLLLLVFFLELVVIRRG